MQGIKGGGSLFIGRPHDYEELIDRDKASLDIFWLIDVGLEQSDYLPDPDVLAQKIVDKPRRRPGTIPRNRRGSGGETKETT